MNSSSAQDSSHPVQRLIPPDDGADYSSAQEFHPQV